MLGGKFVPSYSGCPLGALQWPGKVIWGCFEHWNYMKKMFNFVTQTHLPWTMVVINLSIFSSSSQFQHRQSSIDNRNHWNVLYICICAQNVHCRDFIFFQMHPLSLLFCGYFGCQQDPSRKFSSFHFPVSQKRLFLHWHRKSPTCYWELNSVITAIFQWPNFSHSQRTVKKV